MYVNKSFKITRAENSQVSYSCLIINHSHIRKGIISRPDNLLYKPKRHTNVLRGFSSNDKPNGFQDMICHIRVPAIFV